MAGIGGTGISTVAAIVVMAARIDKLYAQSMNFTGLAQKNGAVTSQIRISKDKSLYTRSARLPNETADLLLGCDAVVSVSPSITRTLNPNKTIAIINGRVEPVGVAGVHIGTVVDDSLLKKHLENHLEEENIKFIDISNLAESLVGDTVSANIMMLGMAAQKSLIPIEISSLEKAIELNGVAIEQNLRAFNWGRLLSEYPEIVFKAAHMDQVIAEEKPIGNYLEKFSEILEQYQDKDYSNLFLSNVNKVISKETKISNSKTKLPLSRKVALTLFRIMRYKDEYEVGRLHTSGEFAKSFLQKNKSVKLEYYLAPPLFSKKDPETGHLVKQKFGPWVFQAFKILSSLKFLRNTKFDIFGYTTERKKERALVKKTLNTVNKISNNLNENNFQKFIDFLDIPLSIKGYGHVKEKNMISAENKWDKALDKILVEKDLKKVS
jgi:indolepyruvate ferredoxin oxidoreductase